MIWSSSLMLFAEQRLRNKHLTMPDLSLAILAPVLAQVLSLCPGGGRIQGFIPMSRPQLQTNRRTWRTAKRQCANRWRVRPLMSLRWCRNATFVSVPAPPPPYSQYFPVTCPCYFTKMVTPRTQRCTQTIKQNPDLLHLPSCCPDSQPLTQQTKPNISHDPRHHQ